MFLFSGFSFSAVLQAVLQANCLSYRSAFFTYTSFQRQLINQIDDSLTSTLKNHKYKKHILIPSSLHNAVWSQHLQVLPIPKPSSGFGEAIPLWIWRFALAPCHAER